MEEEIKQHFLELGVALSQEWVKEALKFLADNPESCTEGSQKEDLWKLFLFNDMTSSSRGTLSEALALDSDTLRGLHVLQILEVINISSNLKEKAVCVLLPSLSLLLFHLLKKKKKKKNTTERGGAKEKDSETASHGWCSEHCGD